MNDAANTDDTLCSQKHSELEQSLQLISVTQRHTTLDAMTGGTLMMASAIGITDTR
jgi:hypothetical protein